MTKKTIPTVEDNRPKTTRYNYEKITIPDRKISKNKVKDNLQLNNTLKIRNQGN